MIRAVTALVCAPLWLSAADVGAVTRTANAVQIAVSEGLVEILWLGPSAVRVQEVRELRELRTAQPADSMEFSIIESGERVRLTSRELSIEIRKKPLGISFQTTTREPVLEQKASTRRSGGQWSLEFGLATDERLFGLGVLDGELNLRGRFIESRRPLLLSSGGYGLFFAREGRYRFDLGKKQVNRLAVAGSDTVGIDYCFYFGAGFKETLEQHHLAWAKEIEVQRNHAAFLTPLEKPAYAETLEVDERTIISRVLHGSLSGISVPAIGTSWLAELSGQRRARAEALVAMMPVVLVPNGFALGDRAQRLRQSLAPHLVTYFAEARERGLPVIHPLAMQFPSDVEAGQIDDEFLLGDELLAAPIRGSGTGRNLYLPQGIWTELKTDRAMRGKRHIQISGYNDEIPLFVRNGSILPLECDGFMELHYFPKLGAEYFIWELGADQVTQVHAAPAADELRLQIEGRVGRTYEWIIHNVRRPVRAESNGVRYVEVATRRDLIPGRWLYDETRKNLHIQVSVKPGDDWILNAGFSEEEWFDFR